MKKEVIYFGLALTPLLLVYTGVLLHIYWLNMLGLAIIIAVSLAGFFKRILNL